ncbi:MAG: LytR C-terminal domain-containing protein [Acidimicrobiia bacterium]
MDLPDDPGGEPTPDEREKWPRWRIGVFIILVLGTVAAAVLLARRFAPSIYDVGEDGVTAAADAIVDAVEATSDTWNRWATRLQRLAEEVPERRVESGPTAARSESLLLVVTDAAGKGSAFALLARSPEAETLLVLMPPRLLAVLPGFGEFAIEEAPGFEGPVLAELTVSNLLGIRMDGVLPLGPGELAGAVVEPMLVDLPMPVILDEGAGLERLLDAGEALRDPVTVEVLLTAQGSDNQFEWLQRQGAVWLAIISRIADDPELADRMAAYSTAAPEAVADLLTAAAEEVELGVTVLSVTRLPVEAGTEAFRLSFQEASSFVEQRLAHLLLREGERPRVEVLNGNGQVGTTRVVSETLIRQGFRLIKTDNADRFTYEETQVIAQGRDAQAAAREALEVLGRGALLLEVGAPSGVVDVSIIVGRDIPAGEG